MVELTYKKYTIGMSEYNTAFAYNYANALSGVTLTIDYAKALVSHGHWHNANDMAATVSGNLLSFTWTDNSGVSKAAATDNTVLVAYWEEQKQTVFSNIGANRSSAAGTLSVKDFAGKTIQTWIAFISKDGREASNSFYTGELVVK